ncbi:FecCD family ABC transporter permease [Teredinibacter franksiae]|uniref:FecCD family ABC transporter permease n=1 Tax=Teredinibacter franksiae TaxID=2761453 RepID=UPI0016277DC2|nr:iron ABC transporter permease [Teredinibacter franksiae]
MLLTVETLQNHWYRILFCALLLVLTVALLSLAFGAVPISLENLFAVLAGKADQQTQLIIERLRIPRTLLALSVGAMLASCGAITQGLFRNPLADPSLIGVSAGASAGAAIVIVLLNTTQWSIAGLSLVTVGAFIGSILTVILVYRISTSSSGTSVTTMLLAGIAVTFLAGSLSNILEFIADNEMLKRITLWRMGGLDAADYTHVGIVAAVMLFVFCVIPFQYSALNALLLGESEARHLGVDVNRIKRRLIIIVAAGVGTSVALAGTISFIGLIVPHIVRMLIGPNHRYLIPLSAVLGALLLVVADTFARTVIAPTEMPVGLVTALIGAPVFISLLRKRYQYGMQ